MSDQLRDIMGRPRRYENIDGTGEIAFGIMALGFTLLGSLNTSVPKDGLLFFALLLLMFGLMRWIPKAIKKRITWPRTGYIAYRTDGKSRWITLVVAGAVSVIVTGGLGWLMRSQGVAMPHDWLSLVWIGNAVILVAAYALLICVAGRQYRWKWLVLLFMVLGLAAIALIFPAHPAQLWRPMVVFVGCMWLASGGATLYLFVRHTPPPAAGAE